jgi:hypothetical protein
MMFLSLLVRSLLLLLLLYVCHVVIALSKDIEMEIAVLMISRE